MEKIKTIPERLEKYDIIFFIIMVPISTLMTGFALYMTLDVSWMYAQLIFISGMFFGIGCLGLSGMAEVIIGDVK